MLLQFIIININNNINIIIVIMLVVSVGVLARVARWEAEEGPGRAPYTMIILDLNI